MKTVPAIYSEVRNQIPHGALGLWRAGARAQDRVIAGTGRSIWCHVQTIATDKHSLEILETTQWRGPQTLRLYDTVIQHPGRIDVFKPNPGGHWDYDSEKCVRETRRVMAQWTGRYGWWTIAKIAARRSYLGRTLLRPRMDDDDNGSYPPVCSSLRAIADCAAGKDPVPNLPNWLVEPGDLGRSLLYADGYLFTLFFTKGQVKQWEQDSKD